MQRLLFLDARDAAGLGLVDGALALWAVGLLGPRRLGLRGRGRGLEHRRRQRLDDLRRREAPLRLQDRLRVRPPVLPHALRGRPRGRRRQMPRVLPARAHRPHEHGRRQGTHQGESVVFLFTNSMAHSIQSVVKVARGSLR